jgi:hypothetical protein
LHASRSFCCAEHGINKQALYMSFSHLVSPVT